MEPRFIMDILRNFCKELKKINFVSIIAPGCPYYMTENTIEFLRDRSLIIITQSLIPESFV